MKLALLRHGSTEGNERRRYVGRRTDEPLSEKGLQECALLGSFPAVAKVYTSPMLRAIQTAQMCFPKAKIVSIPGLEEFDFGVFEGRTADEMVDDAAYRTWVEGGCTGQCPGGESLDGFVLRTKAALADLLRAADAHGEEEVVVVAHGGTIMAALDGFYDKHVGNCEGYIVDVCWESGLPMLECSSEVVISSFKLR